MAAPVTPNEIEELIPSPRGNFCEKFIKSLRLPYLIWKIYAFFVGEDGKITAEAAALFCSLKCKGQGGPGDVGLEAPIISATDGSYLDKIRITWAGIAGATSYLVYRNITSSTADATIVGTVVDTTFDDVTVTQGQIYYYWVKSSNASQESDYSAMDSGFAAEQLESVIDLDATKGFYQGRHSSIPNLTNAPVRIVWTPSSGAERWDIYRSNVNDFSSATLIDSNRVPYYQHPALTWGPTPQFTDNSGELVYFDDTHELFGVVYYWVVGKSARGVSLPSNVAIGWPSGFDDIVFVGTRKAEMDIPALLPVGSVEAWVVLFGSGGGGAGSSSTYGGGGGGGGAIVAGRMPIAGAAPQFRITQAPDPNPAEGHMTTRSWSEQDGTLVPDLILEFSEDGAAWTEVCRCNGSSSVPVFDATGGGAGGGPGWGSNTVLDPVYLYDGRAGRPAIGNLGGRSGFRFGGVAMAGTYILAGGAFHQQDGTVEGTPAGSGASSNMNAALRGGGRGAPGYAMIFYR